MVNLKTELFLSWRYLKPKRNAVSVITCISIIGVTLGVAVLIVVLAVMTGFTDLMKEKLLETTAHIQIYSCNKSYIENPLAEIKKMNECGVEGAPVVYSQALLQKGRKFLPKALIGINPLNSGRIDLSGSIRYGDCTLKPGEIVISEVISNQMNAYVGDKILVHSPGKLAEMVELKKNGTVEARKSGDVYLPEEFRVAGIYSFGKYDFDKLIIFMNLDNADEIAGIPWGTCSVLYGWAKDPFNLKKELRGLNAKMPAMMIRSWKQINSKLLGVLAVEKNMMFFLLIFIVLVAAFSITNTLITVVVQKTREIGLLKAVGATSGRVMRVFVLQGFFVGLMGTVFGSAMGILVIIYRNGIMRFASKYTGMELFPKEFYYFNELPAHIVPGDIITIAIISVFLCTLGGVIPAWRASRLDPAKALRYE